MAILAEKYAVDYTWYVDTILNLIRIAGDYVSEEVWYRVIQIVINRDDVQGYAAKTVFEVRMYSVTEQSLGALRCHSRRTHAAPPCGSHAWVQPVSAASTFSPGCTFNRNVSSLECYRKPSKSSC